MSRKVIGGLIQAAASIDQVPNAARRPPAHGSMAERQP
jgi:hypothetical protein